MTDDPGVLEAELAHMAAVHRLFDVFDKEQASAIVELLDAKEEHRCAVYEADDDVD